jgi:hypothetical protein
LLGLYAISNQAMVVRVNLLLAIEFDDVECPHEDAGIVSPVSDALKQSDAIIPARDRLAIDDARAGAQGHSTHQGGSGARPRSLTVLRHRETINAWTALVRELVLLALLSAFLCGVALIYADPIATAVFAALTSGCVVIAAGLSRGLWT